MPVTKYSIWYEYLVLKAKNRILPADIYREKHHILPHCMGGKKNPDNLVELTAREHYIAHLLLWKMQMPIKWHNKMTMALHVMVNGSGNPKQDRSYLVPARLYEACRIEYVEIIRKRMQGPENPFRGQKHSQETIEKIIAANARTKDIRSAKLSGANNGMFGKHHDEATKARISASSAAAWTDDDKAKKSAWMKTIWNDPRYRDMLLTARKHSEGWLNRDWKAIGRKAADTKMANGWRPSEDAKRKLSETRRAKLASGEIVPWNKGKKTGNFRTSEQAKAAAYKSAATRKLRGTQVALKGEQNPFFGMKHTDETKAKIARRVK